MPSLSLPSFPSLPGLAWPGFASAVFLAYQPALLALAVSLAAGGAGRLAGPGRFAGLAGAAGALAGWAALLPVSSATVRAVWAPRAPGDVLLLPALCAVLLGVITPWLRGRTLRWSPAALVLLVGWWLAGSVPVRAEFWRVWAAVCLAAWLLGRGAGSVPNAGGGRVFAAALALWGGLVATGAGPAWISAALVAVAAGGAAWAMGAALPPVLLVAVAAAADLGAGRLLRGGLNGVDLACILSLSAVWLAPWLGRRLGPRLGRAGPLTTAIASAALLAGAAWLGARLLQR